MCSAKICMTILITKHSKALCSLPFLLSHLPHASAALDIWTQCVSDYTGPMYRVLCPAEACTPNSVTSYPTNLHTLPCSPAIRDKLGYQCIRPNYVIKDYAYVMF